MKNFISKKESWIRFLVVVVLQVAVNSICTAGWIIETIDSNCMASRSPIVLDSNDYPHVSYFGSTPESVLAKYAKWTGTEWKIETIADNLPKTTSHISLCLDSENYPHITYCDRTYNDIKYAKWTGIKWDIQTVDKGYHCSIRSGFLLLLLRFFQER